MSAATEQKVEHEEFAPFNMTPDGFKAAKKWLKMMGLFDEYINGTEDTSGFGVVSYANWCFKDCEERKVKEA